MYLSTVSQSICLPHSCYFFKKHICPSSTTQIGVDLGADSISQSSHRYHHTPIPPACETCPCSMLSLHQSQGRFECSTICRQVRRVPAAYTATQMPCLSSSGNGSRQERDHIPVSHHRQLAETSSSSSSKVRRPISTFLRSIFEWSATLPAASFWSELTLRTKS